MRRLVYVILMFVITTNSFSKPNQPVSDAQHEENCINLSKAAQAFMRVRQDGSSILSVLESVDLVIKDQDRAKILKMIVQDAYKQPKYNTEKNKQDEINEFSAKYYLACMEMYE